MSDSTTSLSLPSFQCSLEKLSESFEALVNSVREQMDAPTPQEQDELRIHCVENARAILGEESYSADQVAETRDSLVELIQAHLARAERIRKTVHNAEAIARRHEAFAKALKNSIELYMMEAGINRIEGLLHRFQIHKQPSELVITNEALIPKKYFKKVVTQELVLDKTRILDDLLHKKEVPGCFLETDRKRLDIK